MLVGLVTTGVVLAVEFSTYSTADLPKDVAIGLLIVICVYVSAFAWQAACGRAALRAAAGLRRRAHLPRCAVRTAAPTPLPCPPCRSWGPLGWLVPSEIQTLETRPAGMACAVSVNFLFSFVIGQAFLSMMCAMEVSARRGWRGQRCAAPAACTMGARRRARRLQDGTERRVSSARDHHPLQWGVFVFFAGWVAVMTALVWFFLPETKGVPVESVPALFARHWAWSRVMGQHAEEVRRLWHALWAGAACCCADHQRISHPSTSPLPLSSPPSTPSTSPLQFIHAEESKSQSSLGSKLESAQ